MRRHIIGALARTVGCISVARPQDKAFAGIGTLAWKAGSTEITGIDSRFHLDLKPGDRVTTGTYAFTVADILEDNKFVSSEKAPEEEMSSPGVAFKVLPRVDQSDVFQAVSQSLGRGEAISIFPEGGSHDRLELLPLKPGVAIMALQAAIQGVEDVMVVPIGLNYYQAHKILSRATVQIGTPFVVREDLVQLYTTDRRAAVAELLNQIQKNLENCIVSAPEYRSLKAVRTSVTLFVPESSVLPSDKYHMLYHWFSILITKNYDNPLLQNYLQEVQHYSRLLKSYGISDHEVRQLRMSAEEAVTSFCQLLLAFLWSVLMGLPLSLLWGPIRAISSLLAEKHRRKALANSKVKVTGRDVVASYKILVMMVLLPLSDLLYGIIFGSLFYRSFWGVLGSAVGASFILPFLYYYSIRHFAKIAPLLRRFKFCLLVLVCKLNAWRDNEREIITLRMTMQLKVRQLINELGPSTSEDFMTTMEHCVPSVVLDIDSKRIQRRLANGEFVPLEGRGLLESREEIL